MNYITSFLGQIINRFLGDYSSTVKGIEGDEKNKEWMDMIKTLVRIVDQFMPVVMIGLGFVGAIYVVILGVKYAKSENDEAKAETKKKLINGIVGILIGLLIMIVLSVFLKNSTAVEAWLRQTGASN